MNLERSTRAPEDLEHRTRRLKITPVDLSSRGKNFDRNRFFPVEIENFIIAVKNNTPENYVRDYDIIKKYFDIPYYLVRNPDILLAGLDPVAHYIRAGAKENRDPTLDFSTQFYSRENPEVETYDHTPFTHWVEKGRFLGLKPRPDFASLPKEEVPKTLIAQAALENAEKLIRRSQFTVAYGSKMHRHVLACWLNRPKFNFDEYDIIKPYFDIAYYLMCNPGIVDLNRDPVEHYIRAGSKEGRNPTAYFSDSMFLARYPDFDCQGFTPFASWILRNRNNYYCTSPLKGFSGISKTMGMPVCYAQDKHRAYYGDLRRRLETGELGRQVTKAARLEPIVENSWPAALQIRIAPLNSDIAVARTLALDNLKSAARFKSAQAVVVVNRPRWGGGRRMEGFLTHALAEIYGVDEVVFVTSEEAGEFPPDKLPNGIRIAQLAEIDLPNTEKPRILFEFLRSLSPKIVFNVNSRSFWDMLNIYGSALSEVSKISCVLFCPEQTPRGYWTGYPINHFYKNFRHVDMFCTDSRHLRDELVERYQLTPPYRERVRALALPVDPKAPCTTHSNNDDRRPNVFWAGRFDPQKRIDIVYRIAALVPEVSFHMWGEPLLGAGVKTEWEKPANVFHEQPYRDFSELPISDADLWLYTSEWDGVPSLLLEVAMAGVPIVGSQEGGSSEIIREETSFPVASLEDIRGFADAIRSVLKDPIAARKKAQDLRAELIRTRSHASFVESIAEICPS